jgi:hypothetical protein
MKRIRARDPSTTDFRDVLVMVFPESGILVPVFSGKKGMPGDSRGTGIISA